MQNEGAQNERADEGVHDEERAQDERADEGTNGSQSSSLHLNLVS